MKILVAYWSGSGNTQAMAESIADGLKRVTTDVDLLSVEEVDINMIGSYEKVVLGCPSMGIETLEEEEFEPFFQTIKPLLKDKLVGLFGSYGWGDGEWMDAWQNECQNSDIKLFEVGVKVNGAPSATECEELKSYGERFAKA